MKLTHRWIIGCVVIHLQESSLELEAKESDVAQLKGRIEVLVGCVYG